MPFTLPVRSRTGPRRYSPAAVDAIQAIVLGIVQGLTEFLPVSSTGHLRIVPAILGWEDPGAAFTAVTQLGHDGGGALYFRNDLWRIAEHLVAQPARPGLRGTLDARMGWYIGLGTIPIAIFGLALPRPDRGRRALAVPDRHHADRPRPAPAVRGAGGQARSRGRGHRRARRGVSIGFAQALALDPRRVALGRDDHRGPVLGFDREAAARYSFLLSIPAVVLSGLFEMRKIGDAGGAGASRPYRHGRWRSSSATRRSPGCCAG